MNRRIILLSLLLSLFTSVNLFSQLVDCISFNEPEVGTVFSTDTGVSPGDVAHNYGDISMVMGEYTNVNGDTEFGNINISDFPVTGTEEPFLFISFATATFLFPEAQSIVCFVGSISGHAINLGINGSNHVFDNLLDPNIQETFPNHEITAIQDGELVYVCISNVEAFTIGGIEQLVDNICAEPVISTCFANEFTIVAECGNDNTYDIYIDFDPVGVTNDNFDLFIDGEFYDFVPFAALPITISNIIPNHPEEGLEVRIQENDNPECVHTEVLTLPTCNEECSISNLGIGQYACDENSESFNFYLNFDYNNLTVDSFILEINGVVYGLFSYNNLPLTNIELALEAGTVAHFLVRDHMTEGCAEDANIEVHNCEFACADFAAEFHSFDCLSPSTGIIRFELSTPPTDDQFFLVDQEGNVTYDTYYTNSNFIAFDVDFDLAENNQSFLLIDNLTGCETIVGPFGWLFADCEFCEIYDLNLTPTECDEFGQFYIDVTFEASYPEDIFYIGLEEDVLFGPYTFADMPMRIGPVDGANPHSALVYVFNEDNNCSATEDITYGCEPDNCFLSEVAVGECHSDQSADLFVNLASPLDGGPFIIEVNGNIVASVGLFDFPATLAGVLPYGPDEEIIIHIYEDGGECEETYILFNDCMPVSNECNFTEIFAEAHSCDGDQFLVDVEFANPNGGELGFYIFGDGMIFGPYPYGETFYTFGPLSGTSANHTIMLLDISNPACFGNDAFDYSCTDECQIISVNAEPTECNDDGLFSVVLNVEASNHGENFTVVGNGNNYGEFSYADLPITLGPFEGDGESPLEFGVIDLQNANCTNWTSLISPNCQPCDIRDFEYEVSCGEESYELSINFIYENPESDKFLLMIGNQAYESYFYSELPLTIENIPFAFNGESIRVEDIEYELCGETIDFNLPCCNLGNLLNELIVTDCQENGEYYLRVENFNGSNLSDSLVIDYAPSGSGIIATVTIAYADLSEDIGPLVGDGSTGYLFVFSDQNNDCSLTRTLEPVFCDDSSCVEFEGTQGVFGPDFNHDSGDLILEENSVNVTYERNPVTDCACNLFILDGLVDVNFGTDHVVVTQNSGFGLNFSNVSSGFNTVNIDFYHPGADVSISVNGEDAVTVSNFSDFPTNIAAGVELQVTFDPDTQQGMLTFSGEIESIQLFSNETAAFDNVCLSLDDNIWPGDTNSDNYAGHFDLLNIGIAYGSTGSSRSAVNDEWEGYIGQNWGDSFANGINYKHADANGDGIVNEDDQLVLELNYGQEHGVHIAYESLPYTDVDPAVYLDVPEAGEFPNGAAFEIPIIAGTSDQIIDDIYGLAFTLTVDPDVIDLSSIEIVYPTSWFGEPGVNTIHLHHINSNGEIEVAISRSDLNPVSGFGPIMYLRGIIDDIAAITPSTGILMDKVYAIDGQENQITIRPQSAQLNITQANPTIDRDMLRSTFSIFPNPASDIVYFSNAYHLPADKISVYNNTGQMIFVDNNPEMNMNVSQLPAGVYHLKIHLQGFIFTERLVVIE